MRFLFFRRYECPVSGEILIVASFEIVVIRGRVSADINNKMIHGGITMRIEGMDAVGKSYDYAAGAAASPERVRMPSEAPQTGQVVQHAQEPDTFPAQQPDEKLVRAAVDKANKQMAAREVSIQFEAHEVMNEMIVRIIDKSTKEVIREIPSKKILDMVANMLEMVGLLVDKRG
jgi:uncharacterized FlaG/YvyC family protein